MDYICTLYSKEQFLSKIGKSKNETILNTFDYIFEKISKGIFVEIYKGEIKHFIIFINKNYTNNWSTIIKEKINLHTKKEIKEFIFTSIVKYYYVNFKIKKSFESYMSEWRRKFKWDKYELIISKWYANNGIFRFDNEKSHSSKNVTEVLRFLTYLWKNHEVKNSNFFINTRDSRIIGKNYFEPYFNIFGKNVKVEKRFQTRKAKVFSFSTNKHLYNDLLFPTYLDVSSKYDDMNLNWNLKINKALFRGSTTGFEVENQRIKLYKLYFETDDDFIDIGFTKIQTRPRIENGKIKFIEDDVKPFNSEYLSYKQQSNYKVIIHVAGNVEAFRLSAELASGSCIVFVKINGLYGIQIIMLKPNVHYIPVKEDLSDFFEKIE